MLRIHLGMTGRWRRRERWPRTLPYDLGLALRGQGATWLVVRPTVMDRFDARRLDTHEVLSALGPDLAAPTVDVAEIVARVRARAPHETLADVLMCQQVAAGLGNVYKSEVLFIERLSPFLRADQVEDAELARMFVRGHQLLRTNLRPGARNTTGRVSPRLWVYGARRRGCPRCRGKVHHMPQGVHQRVTWWCPTCQEGA
jgi:endonuclease-8